MARITGIAHLPFIGCLALVVACVLHLVAFISPYWTSDGTWEKGLWRFGTCRNEKGPKHFDCSQHVNGASLIEDWLWAVRILQAVAIPFLAIAPVTIPIYMYVSDGIYYTCMMASMFLCTLLGALCTLVSLVVFAIKVTEKSWSLSWCYIVSCIGCGVSFIGLLLFLGSCISNRPNLKRDYFESDMVQVVPDMEKPKSVYTVE